MKLIADSGSTKTDWTLVGPQPCSAFHTQGLNPYHLAPQAISGVLREELLPQLRVGEVGSVCFYGSGVSPEMAPKMEALLREVFSEAETVEAHSDLLGAARALCGAGEGIACILGTGANSCLYDGERIVRNTPALGYILGDEGSGAVLGRTFLNALYKGVLSKEIMLDFERATGLTMATVIDRVYRQPMANRFLASLSEFIHARLDDDGVHRLVVGCFEAFFARNIVPYGRRDLPVSFVGSIAYYYQAQLLEAADRQQFQLGAVVKSPLEGLVRYHA